MTLFTASRKSFSVTVFLRARMAYIPASVHTLLISAPGKQKPMSEKWCPIYKHYGIKTEQRRCNRISMPLNSGRVTKGSNQTNNSNRKDLPVEFGHSRARSSNLTSLSQFIVRVWILNICVLLSISGRPNSTLRSNRPGRNNAGSSVSGLKRVEYNGKGRLDKRSCLQWYSI